MIAKDLYIEAPPHIVYSFLTDPSKISEWIGTEIDVDPRPGGIFRIVPNRVDVIRGTYLEVEANAKVSFTWGFEGEGHAVPAGSTVVEITLRPEGTGTRLNLIHRNLTGEWRDKHDAGWNHYVQRIKIAAEGGPLEADPFADPSVRHG
jgi:uncharacterized protein YndB with AHSA1/START domain